MKIAASFLDIKEPKMEELKYLDSLDIDYIHLDVMDGIFVENKTYTYEEFYDITRFTTKPKDIHLMVSDVKKYIDEFAQMKPKFITFHYEAVSEVSSVINYIKELGIGVGISIKPTTDVSEVVKYLPYLDLILVMSVEPGRGGQAFIEESIKKIEQLYTLREKENYHYQIEVDGGINNETIKKCNKADICVVGSYITRQDYKEAIRKLRD
ncbi:MAG: ribulose-phosphate 3-epimerase [Firmicutes bacterium]|nr:ribulose-phosphate 3-epimerase [Bacillota bacterium]